MAWAYSGRPPFADHTQDGSWLSEKCQVPALPGWHGPVLLWKGTVLAWADTPLLAPLGRRRAPVFENLTWSLQAQTTWAIVVFE